MPDDAVGSISTDAYRRVQLNAWLGAGSGDANISNPVVPSARETSFEVFAFASLVPVRESAHCERLLEIGDHHG
jgi:hypothetical protein